MAEYDVAVSKLAMSEDELLLEFGGLLVGTTRDGAEQDRRRRAQNWFTSNRKQLREAICGNEKLAGIRANPEGVVLLAGLLGEYLGQSAAFGVAAYLLKQGLDRLCAD